MLNLKILSVICGIELVGAIGNVRGLQQQMKFCLEAPAYWQVILFI